MSMPTAVAHRVTGCRYTITFDFFYSFEQLSISSDADTKTCQWSMRCFFHQVLGRMN